MSLEQLAAKARAASLRMAVTGTDVKNRALKNIRETLRKQQDAILEANREDLSLAEKNQLSAPLLKRLRFDNEKLEEVIRGINDLIALPDPVGRTLTTTELDQGLELYKISCPIGVIGIIFESRPDALVQISILCLKSGNAVLLKGGSEAAHTNKILAELIHSAGIEAGLPDGWLGLLETREDVKAMLSCDADIDLLIPRGSNAFVRYIMENTKIPVLGHADGICHMYVDARADQAMAIKVVTDAKCQYVAVCNALETLLVHRECAPAFLPELAREMTARHVELRGCPATREIIPVKPATEEDWATEYLDYILSVKIVSSTGEAITHINRYGSKHTDAIITTDAAAAALFLDAVDSANVFWNCSTRFSDGYKYGLGAEVGISTNKIHARGPVGMEGLLIYKWKLVGQGQTAADYAGASGKKFGHRKLDKEFTV